jgi:cytoskeletal protein CcmA (bactofilin family)
MAQTRTTGSGARDSSDARIGSAARVRGRIHGDGNLVIEGHVEGSVTLRGDLTIAEGATVTGETISAHAVHVAGSLEGNVTATGPVRLASGARVRGDLQGSAIVLEDGARFSGKLDCEFDLPPELGGASQGEARGRASDVRSARR